MEKQKDSYDHILKYTGLFGGVQGLNILIGVVRSKFVALILGPEGMGLVSLFNSTITLLSNTTDFGIPMSAVRSLSEAYESGDKKRIEHTVLLIRFWSFLAAFLGLVLCAALSPLLSRWTFDWGNHTLHFLFLSPVIALAAITGGETAVLKGVRQLRRLAVISLYGMIGSLLSSVPLYYVWGQAAIIPSLFIVGLIQCVLTVGYSYKLYPLHLHQIGRGDEKGIETACGTEQGYGKAMVRNLWHEGGGMIRLGVAFVLAGIMASGADFVIRGYLNHTGDLAVVGLYNAGYVMTVTYAGLVFSAMETDYFPRLSGISHLGSELNLTVNRQIEVCLLIVSPLLVLFILVLPVLMPLLFSGKFLPVVDMMRITTVAMYFRAVSMPVEYIALSRGDSSTYLFQEGAYAVLLIVAVILGYRFFGLTGTGWGLLAVAVINVVMVLTYTSWRYHYRMSRDVLICLFGQMPLGVAAVLVLLYSASLWAISVGVVLFMISATFSLHQLRAKTALWTKLVGKVEGKIKKILGK